MRWTVHGERTLYDSDWVRLTLVDVELPSGDRFEHHVVRIPREAAATIVRRDGAVLLNYRHRFITDRWSWELPAGRLEPGESPEEAAIRETVEETGWRPSALSYLGGYNPLPGMVDQTFHVFLADDAEWLGEPESDETGRVEWVPVERVRQLIASDEIPEGYTLTALCWALVAGEL